MRQKVQWTNVSLQITLFSILSDNWAWSSQWSYWPVRKYDNPYLQKVRQSVPTNSRKRPTWHPSVRTNFIRLGSVTTNRKDGRTGEQLVVGTDSRSVSTGPSRMFSVLTEGCHVSYSWEFVGTVYCTYGQSNTTNRSGDERYLSLVSNHDCVPP